MRFDSSRIQEIFAEALLEGSAEARERFLDEACAGAPELRAQVESLLRAHDQAGQLSRTNHPAPRPSPSIDLTGPTMA